jgi:ABC-type transporter Mla MlaB component
MGSAAPRTTAFTIRGPLARADLPCLCERIRALLEETGAQIALCDVSGAQADAVTIDALARLLLAARRYGCDMRLLRPSLELLELVGFMGLAELLCRTGSDPAAPARPSPGA